MVGGRYELLNEPWAGDVIARPGLLIPGVADRENLQPFYFNVTAAIRAVDPHHVIAVESVTWDDVRRRAPVLTVSCLLMSHLPAPL